MPNDINSQNKPGIFDNLMSMEANSKKNIKAAAESPSLLKDYFANKQQLEQAKKYQLSALEQGDISPTLAQKAAPVFAKLQSKLESNPNYALADAQTKLALAQEELRANKDKTMTPGEIFARSLIAVAPALVGYGLAGSTGGIAGAEASKEVFRTASEIERAQQEALSRKQEREGKLGFELLKYQKEAEKAVREEGFKTKDLQLKERAIVAKEQEAARKAAPGVTTLPPDKIMMLTEFKNIPSLLEDLQKSIEANEKLFGRGIGKAAQTISKVYPLDVVDTLQAQIANVRQTIGKLKEGGVLRAEDEIKYQKMFPQLTDTPEVAKNKIALVLREMNRKYLENVNALKTAGYDVSPFTQQKINVPELPYQAKKSEGITLPGQMREAQAAEKPKKVIQNGVEYIFNPATGQYE